VSIIKTSAPRRLARAGALVVLAACTAPGATQSPATGPADGAARGANPDSIAAALIRATLPPSPRQTQFAWELDEAGARFQGRGVARYHAPDRFRLDLFGPRGETYVAAALVGDQPRVPAALAERFKLPSPALLWAGVGVVRPPAGARLTAAEADGDAVTLRYDLGPDGTLEYRARGSRLVSVRRLKGGGVQESVDLDRAADGTPRSARYREWIALRNLNLSLEATTDVASFPEDVWSPPGTGR